MRFFCILALIMSGQVAFGAPEASPSPLSDKVEMTSEQAFLYRQSELALTDPIGDKALLLRVRRSSKNILRHLLKIESPKNPGVSFDEDGPAQDSSSTAPSAEPQIEGSEKPIYTQALLAMLQQVILEESQTGVTPSLGEFHQWSDQIKRQHPFSPTLRFSKILTALALGVSSRVLITEQEGPLKEYLLSQSDNSVTLEMIFRQSYRLNQGNVYLTLLTIENLLSANWKAPNRERIPYIVKLKAIHSHYNGGGDKYGFWYHLFGTMLYGYVQGRIPSQWVGGVEALGSKILAKFEYEKQETFANFLGGKIGAQLRSKIKQFQKHQRFLNFTASSEYLREESYLHKTEDFRDRMSLPVTGEFTAIAQINERRNWIYLRNRSNMTLQNCQIDIFAFPGARRYRGQALPTQEVSLAPDQGFYLELQGSSTPTYMLIYILNAQTCLRGEGTLTSAQKITFQ